MNFFLKDDFCHFLVGAVKLYAKCRMDSNGFTGEFLISKCLGVYHEPCPSVEVVPLQSISPQFLGASTWPKHLEINALAGTFETELLSFSHWLYHGRVAK